MEDDPDSIVIISSAESLEYYPGNKPACFSNWLQRPLNFHHENEYEVGLAQIIISSKPQLKPLIEDNDSKRIDIYKTKTTAKTLRVPKQETLEEWISTANFQIIMSDFPAQFVFDSLGDKVANVEIENKSESNLGLSHNMLRALGYPMETVPKGLNKPMVPIQESIYNAIPNDTEIIITLYPDIDFIESYLPMLENKYSISELVNSINRLLNILQLRAQLEITRTETIFTYDADEPLKLKIPEKIAHALGLASVIDLVKPGFRQANNIRRQPSNDLMYISCNVLSPTQCGSRFVNWLRIINQPQPYNQVHVIDMPIIQYVPVAKTFLQVLHIDILNERGDQFQLDGQNVMITLKFRARKE